MKNPDIGFTTTQIPVVIQNPEFGELWLNWTVEKEAIIFENKNPFYKSVTAPIQQKNLHDDQKAPMDPFLQFCF